MYLQHDLLLRRFLVIYNDISTIVLRLKNKIQQLRILQCLQVFLLFVREHYIHGNYYLFLQLNRIQQQLQFDGR